MERQNVILAIILVSIISVGAVSFTTISNPVEVTPVVELSSFMGGQKIADIDTATISGTVTFTATITNDPLPEVNIIRLEISQENVDTTNKFYFTKSSDPKIWDLALDTTTLQNGEYTFVFFVENIDPSAGGGDPGGVDVAFSTLSFTFTDGNGTVQGNDYFWLLIISGVILLFVILYRRR